MSSGYNGPSVAHVHNTTHTAGAQRQKVWGGNT